MTDHFACSECGRDIHTGDPFTVLLNGVMDNDKFDVTPRFEQNIAQFNGYIFHAKCAFKGE